MNISFKKNSGSKVKTPNCVVYFIVFILLTPIIKIMFRMKYDRSGFDIPSGSFVTICNHASFMDFLTVMMAVYPHRLNAVVAQKYFFYKPLDKFLSFMGCIPKNLFDPDTRSVMRIISVIKDGGKLLLFPEGRCTTGGGYMGMHKATGKLIKRLGVPVVCCHIEGAYNCMPLWRKGIRWGHQRAALTVLFTGEEVDRLTADEINLRIDMRLSGADSPPPVRPLTVLRERNLVLGLEHILYFCPNCKQEFTHETSGNIIKCTACGNAAAMDRSAKLTPLLGSVAPESVQLWYKEQVHHETGRLLDADEIFNVEVNVRMPVVPGKGLELCGHGMLSLDKTGWSFSGSLSGEDVRLFFPIDTVPAVPLDPNDNFQIYAQGNFYAFTPRNNPVACIKYSVIGECAYQQFASHIQMTPSAAHTLH